MKCSELKIINEYGEGTKMERRVFEAQYKKCGQVYIKITLNCISCYGMVRENNSSLEYLGEVLFDFENIHSIELVNYKRKQAICVEGVSTRNIRCSVVLPNLTNIDEIRETIDKCKYEKEQIDKGEEQRKLQEEKERIQNFLMQLRDRQPQKEYYENQVRKFMDKYPTYIFNEEASSITFAYIDENRNFNIKSVDKIKMECVFSTLGYQHIHYYEKAGAIHYVTDINIDYQGSSSFGGSFVPGKVSLAPAIVGGLLAGGMGMAVGAMIGYKPERYVPPQISTASLKANSQAQRIDDRSVILNYFSEKNKQYMDVEFPADIYNFLQTHYAEKKYDIVIAMEKRKYVPDTNTMLIKESEKKEEMSLEEFEKAVKKLKIMKDNDLISEEEYAKKKMELLQNI